MGVCLVACSCGQYTGLCVFGALRKVASILAFAGLRVNGYRKKRKIVKDEKKLHGTVDKSSSEQHFRISDTITFVV